MGKIAGKHSEMTAHYQKNMNKNMNKNNDEKGKRLKIFMNNLVVLQLLSDS